MRHALWVSVPASGMLVPNTIHNFDDLGLVASGVAIPIEIIGKQTDRRTRLRLRFEAGPFICCLQLGLRLPPRHLLRVILGA